MGIARRAVHDARPAHLNYKFIERLIRNARLDLYGAGYGRIIHMSESEVDISGLFSVLHAGGYGTFISVRQEEVNMV